MIGRVREVVGRRGVLGTVRALGRLLPWTRFSDEFIFYELDLTDPDRPRRELDAGLSLRRGAAEDVALLEALPHDPEVTAMTEPLARGRLETGAIFWLVTEGEKVAFACWNFFWSGPLTGARGPWRELPDRVVLLEDSISSPDFRGRGVAPAAWSAIADFHAAEGRTVMVTKVAVDNAAVRHALEKVGFREVVHMHRSGPLYAMRIAIRDGAGGPTEHWLRSLQTRG